jgi:hypothetical protein
MIELALLLTAVALGDRSDSEPPITVTGRRASYFNRVICQQVYNSATTRIRSSGARVCLTRAQRDDLRDQQGEFFEDLARRNGPAR